MLISVTSIVIISQQYFLYSPAIFIPVNAKSISAPTRQPPQKMCIRDRDYALSHQKKVEIPVEKPVLYQKCGNCKQTAYLNAKEKYDMQREKLAGRYKTKTAMYLSLIHIFFHT